MEISEILEKLKSSYQERRHFWTDEELLNELLDMLALAREAINIKVLNSDPYIQSAIADELVASPSAVVLCLVEYISVLQSK